VSHNLGEYVCCPRIPVPVFLSPYSSERSISGRKLRGLLLRQIYKLPKRC